MNDIPKVNAVLCGISSMATRPLLADLVRAWQPGGVELRFESTGGVDAARRVAVGEVFDLVVLAADAMSALAAGGHVQADSLRPIANSAMAIAAKSGAPPPDVSSEGALREAVLRAHTIGYSSGPSGVALMALFDKWGISPALDGRLLQARPGVPVGTLIAEGAVDLGFQQLSELLNVGGIVVLGAMPPGVEVVTTFTGAIGTHCNKVADARRALEFLSSDAAADIKRRHGMAAVN
jgi:molybdate transport system substrate-binding protein